ncbi:5'-methylthioadenosine/S-adenosylhomocysteine nucleosidase [Phenylobacterium sp. J367]|uniref:5'-methylthioadenosine/S-adenosylhomocysteine nucleosidase n=1 Tax=Phenylobacterium sp. J367 TaxID=2898435 RepID=UPI0021506D2B|nr:5'-methylthioadenosine/S-adenosylhomocysteine nucleosidase [Phenylobacterium sp. J367]MCR5879351.1 5'-methylthioadenosine/S-adenosylhomocysteine nucleosidase [Phenylobacterium sp. J367]
MRALLILIAVLLAAAPAAAAGRLDATPRIAVVSAYAPEWPTLLAATAVEQTHTAAGVRFVTGTMEGKPVVLFLSGVSMVNAAMSTQAAIDHFAISRVVFSGVAGGVDPGLGVGDVVVADKWGQYLEGAFLREGPEGYVRGPWPPETFPGYGMMVAGPVQIARGEAEPERRFWFAADPALLETARRIAPAVPLKRCQAADRCLAHQPKVVIGGAGVSGPVFVDNKAFREHVSRTFQAKVLDMETAAVAHVAYANGVPFIAFRSLSDLAGGDEGPNQIQTFLTLASENSAAVVRAFVKALP